MQEYANAGVVMFYMASIKEVQTKEAIKVALEAGKTVLLPISNLTGKKLRPARLGSLEDLRKGPFGIMEPADRNPFDADQIELVVVPGLSFDEEGNRIGYGLGFYDRFLSNVSALKVALSYESQIIDKVPTEPHDVPVDRIVTESRVIDCDKNLRLKTERVLTGETRTETPGGWGGEE